MLWEELSWPQHKKMAEAGAVVVLPFASIEQHGPHNPVVVDTLLCTSVCRKAAEGLGNVLLAPTMWAGMSLHHADYPGTLTLTLETYLAVVQELLRSIARSGYKKVLAVNGHGGNINPVQSALVPVRYDLGIEMWFVTYYQLGDQAAAQHRKSAIGGMGHSCEFETAIMLHLRPDLVNMKEAVKNPNVPRHPLMVRDMHHGGKLHRPSDFNRNRAPSGVSGDPTVADAATGEKFFEACVTRLREIIQAMAAL
ncbi:MAG: creatininase family protein [Nitrospinota bacterium]